MLRRREKVFGPGRRAPLDRNVKVRIRVYARARSRALKGPRQHKGPLTRTGEDVLDALIRFHSEVTGQCDPGYEAIAAKAECARSTVAETIKVLEWLGVLTWQQRIVRKRVHGRDLFGRWSWRWRVERTSNAYVLIDPCESENPPGPKQREILVQSLLPSCAAESGEKQALNKEAPPFGDELAAALANLRGVLAWKS